MVVDKETKEWFKTAFLAEFINIFNARNYLPSLPRIPAVDAQESEWINYLDELAKHDICNNLDMWKFLTLLLDRKQASPAICDRINKLLMRTKESAKSG